MSEDRTDLRRWACPAASHHVDREALLRRRTVQGRDRAGVRPQSIQDCPAPDHGTHQRPGENRDRVDGGIDIDLSGRLRDRFGLTRAVVIDTPADDDVALRRHLGRWAAALMTEIVTADDVLGLAWARAVRLMAVELKSLASAPVVQLTGALPRPDKDGNSVQLVRDVAGASGDYAYAFDAPMLMPDATSTRTLRRHRDVVQACGQVASVTKAVVGIGSWEPNQSALYDAMDKKERQRLGHKGVVGEISGVLVTADGGSSEGAVSQRIISINAAQLRAVPEVIAIPYGVAKAPAVRAALLGGTVNSLVTHSALAHALLAK